MIKKIIKYTISYSLTILTIGGIIVSFIWKPETAPLLGKLNDMSLILVVAAYVIGVVLICCAAALVVWIGFSIYVIGGEVHKWLWKE